jgi:predicted DNA-binding transcriptional regulator YafY
MYNGATVNAYLAFDNSLVSVVLDHFGSDTRLSDHSDGRFTINADVSTSPVFLGWMFQFGGKAEILAPEVLREAMREMVEVVGGLHG